MAMISTVVWTVGMLREGDSSTAVDYAELANEVFGEDVETLTLIDPVGLRRVLLVTNETSDHSRPDMKLAIERVVECYLASDYVLDESSDLVSLGSLLPTDRPDHLCRKRSLDTARRLKELGFSGVARITLDDRDLPVLLYQDDANGLHSILLEDSADCFVIPESLDSGSAREVDDAGVLVDCRGAAGSPALQPVPAVILESKQNLGDSRCPRTREPNFDRSWTLVPLPCPGPSMLWSPGPSPTQDSKRPTSPVAPPPMSLAIPMSA